MKKDEEVVRQMQEVITSRLTHQTALSLLSRLEAKNREMSILVQFEHDRLETDSTNCGVPPPEQKLRTFSIQKMVPTVKASEKGHHADERS